MKKTAAVLGSILFYVGVFLVLFFASIGTEIRWFLFGVPLLTAAYFIIAGNIFFHRLNLRRSHLWLSMNLAGGLCGWIILLACFPNLLMNGFLLVLMVPLAGIFAVVWAVVGLGFLCVKWFRSRGLPLTGGKDLRRTGPGNGENGPEKQRG